MARRPRGSIEARGPSTFRITIPLGRRPDGTYDRHRETFHGSEKDAEKRLTALLHQMDTNRLANSGTMTFGQYLNIWLNSYADVYTAPSTAEMYRRHAEKRIIPALGHVRLSELSSLHIKQFYGALQKDGTRLDGKPGGLSINTIHKVHVTIHQALEHAVNDKLIPYNPAASIKLPPIRRPKKRLWNWDQLAQFMEVVREHPQRALVITLAYAGLRISEALALKWDDVDFTGRRLRVDESLRRAGPEAEFGDTKNYRVRTIPMEDELARVLKEHRIAQQEMRFAMGRKWNRRNIVFPNAAGNPMHRQNFYSRVWRPLHEEANRRSEKNGLPPLPYINVHGLRHTFATVLLSGGADAKAVSEMLGHHSVAFTLDEYHSPDESIHRAAISIFSRARQNAAN